MEAESKWEAQLEEEHFPSLPNAPQSDPMSPAITRKYLKLYQTLKLRYFLHVFILF